MTLNSAYLHVLTDAFYIEIIILNSSYIGDLAAVFHFVLPKMLGPVFVAKADLAGLAISAGSACSSGTTTHSEILVALGKSELEAQRGIRISFGRETTKKELDLPLYMKE